MSTPTINPCSNLISSTQKPINPSSATLDTCKSFLFNLQKEALPYLSQLQRIIFTKNYAIENTFISVESPSSFHYFKFDTAEGISFEGYDSTQSKDKFLGFCYDKKKPGVFIEGQFNNGKLYLGQYITLIPETGQFHSLLFSTNEKNEIFLTGHYETTTIKLNSSITNRFYENKENGVETVTLIRDPEETHLTKESNSHYFQHTENFTFNEQLSFPLPIPSKQESRAIEFIWPDYPIIITAYYCTNTKRNPSLLPSRIALDYKYLVTQGFQPIPQPSIGKIVNAHLPRLEKFSLFLKNGKITQFSLEKNGNLKGEVKIEFNDGSLFEGIFKGNYCKNGALTIKNAFNVTIKKFQGNFVLKNGLLLGDSTLNIGKNYIKKIRRTSVNSQISPQYEIDFEDNHYFIGHWLNIGTFAGQLTQKNVNNQIISYFEGVFHILPLTEQKIFYKHGTVTLHAKIHPTNTASIHVVYYSDYKEQDSYIHIPELGLMTQKIPSHVLSFNYLPHSNVKTSKIVSYNTKTNLPLYGLLKFKEGGFFAGKFYDVDTDQNTFSYHPGVPYFGFLYKDNILKFGALLYSTKNYAIVKNAQYNLRAKNRNVTVLSVPKFENGSYMLQEKFLVDTGGSCAKKISTIVEFSASYNFQPMKSKSKKLIGSIQILNIKLNNVIITSTRVFDLSNVSLEIEDSLSETPSTPTIPISNANTQGEKEKTSADIAPIGNFLEIESFKDYISVFLKHKNNDLKIIKENGIPCLIGDGEFVSQNGQKRLVFEKIKLNVNTGDIIQTPIFFKLEFSDKPNSFFGLNHINYQLAGNLANMNLISHH